MSRSLHPYFRAKTRECRPIFHKSLRIYSLYHLFSLFLRSVALSAAYIRRGMRYLVRCQNHSLYQLSEYLPDLSFSSPLAQTISKHLGAWSWINIGLSVTCWIYLFLNCVSVIFWVCSPCRPVSTPFFFCLFSLLGIYCGYFGLNNQLSSISYHGLQQELRVFLKYLENYCVLEPLTMRKRLVSPWKIYPADRPRPTWSTIWW